MAYRQAVVRQERFSAGDGAAPFRLPCTDQTSQSLERWLERHASPGTIVVVRHARWHLYEYHLDEIAKVNRRARRVHLALHGSFDLTGAATAAPKNSLTLLEPTPAVLAAAAEGRTWQHGRPAFKRPLADREIELARAVRAAGDPTADGS